MPDLEFAAGYVFFRPGDAADRAFLLHAGQVEVLEGEGASTRVALFGPGDVFGEMALIEERPRSFTARAVAAGRATPMTREEFEHLLTHDPSHARHYLRSLFERLRALGGRSSAAAVAAAAAPAAPAAPAGPVELPPAGGRTGAWVVVVHPLTRKAAETLPDEGLRVSRYPLRMGRAAAAGEKEALDLNDVWLLDEKPFNVSRNHCEIDVGRDGPLIRDRGSQLGCVVNDARVGGQSFTDYALLEPGENVLVIGGRMSPYQFRLTVGRA